MVESHFLYNNLVTEQTSNAINILLPKFLKIVEPINIVEIGTASGGFTHFLSDTCPNSQIITIELKDYYHYDFKKNVTSIIVDSNDKNLIKDIMIPFIQSTGTTIVFCDGGNKIIDFINYAPLIKQGDYICVHDYCKTRKIFNEEYYNKIWNYCRIVESDIVGICDEYGLVSVHEEMQKGMWVVKQKISNIITKNPKSLL